MSLNFEHSYAEQLPEFYVSAEPSQVPDPRLLQFNQSLARELGLAKELTVDVAPRIFSGNELPEDAMPIAQAYAGHQFGGFSAQLGDGRALLLGEVIDDHGRRRDIALKGSGKTLFSRGGDGKAAVGPVLREYLIGEAMHALGIPTTRALAAVATGEKIMRERPLPGAVLTRVAASHVRVGTFQFFSARGQFDHVRKLADYVIARHYPEVSEDVEPYLSLLRCVVERQAELVARWMLVGFIHGVMNTDNMTISGETIDYGPCAFMDSYDPQTVFSSIDRDGRYAYMNQPNIAIWNLARFAETLLPLLDGTSSESNSKDEGEQKSEQVSKRAVADAMAVLETFMPIFEQHWYTGARTKLGLHSSSSGEAVSELERALIDDWLQLLAKNKVDYTLAWRQLADVAEGNTCSLHSYFAERSAIDAWLERWKKLHHGVPAAQVAKAIRTANPLYIPRNHLVEEALAAASDDGDMQPFEELLAVIQNPFEEQPQCERFALPASAEFNANYRTFCGT
ncbi:MAG: YdiU family protein [Planctomycetota bacterium]